MSAKHHLLLTNLAACILLSACDAAKPPPAADLVFLDGKVITVDNEDHIVQALAVAGGRIVATGENATIERYVGPATRVIALGGRAVTPGLIDSHNHFVWGASDITYKLDLVYPAARSVGDVAELVQGAVTKAAPGEWILGEGWDQGKLTEMRNLRSSDLDPVSRANPVWLGHTSGHFGVANSLALELAGIDRNTPDPDGGWIERDANGNPTGVLADNAQHLVLDVVPDYTIDQYASAVARMAPKLNAAGITTIKDPQVSEAFWSAYSLARQREQLPLRVFALWRAPDSLAGAKALLGKLRELGESADPADRDRLASVGVKIYVDGSGTVRTAWMHDDWNRNLDETDTDNRGFPVVDPAILEQQIRLFHGAGVHLGVHAIGDRAIDFTVDTYDKVLMETPTAGLRHSIIHCNIPSEHAISVMARLQRLYDAAFPETQPAFTWWIADAYAANFGRKRNARMIPLRTYLDEGIIWGSSSDYNVTPFPPAYGIWASVERESLLGTWGRHPFGTDESISVRDALRSYTAWNARQVFMEDRIGTLEVGKYADLVVWDRDPYSVPADELRDLQAQLTILGGEVVFEREAAQ